MSKPVLIVGGGPAGLAAAHSLATVGKDCVIVEKEDRLGGAPILSGYAKLVPSGEWAKDAIGGMVKRVEDEDGVTVITGATVTDSNDWLGRTHPRIQHRGIQCPGPAGKALLEWRSPGRYVSRFHPL